MPDDLRRISPTTRKNSASMSFGSFLTTDTRYGSCWSGSVGWGRAWLAAISECPEVELVGLVDLDTEAAGAAAVGTGLDLAVGTDAVEVAGRSGGQAVIDVTVPGAHHPVTTAALFAGLPVLGEKPVASSVAQGLSLAAAAEITGELFMVSQSRRYNAQLWTFKDQISSLGRTGVLTTEFFKAPHFGGFRDEMDHPLLLDMAVHQLDSARFLLDSDPVAVYCEEYNPAWSWYRGDARLHGHLRDVLRRTICLHRDMVQCRSRDVVERILAGQRGVRLRFVERR